MKKKFLGKSLHRLASNPREQVFSRLWQEENQANSRASLLELLLSEDGGKTPAVVSEREEMLVATVIQWLGSPVGWSWLNQCLEDIKREA